MPSGRVNVVVVGNSVGEHTDFELGERLRGFARRHDYTRVQLVRVTVKLKEEGGRGRVGVKSKPGI